MTGRCREESFPVGVGWWAQGMVTEGLSEMPGLPMERSEPERLLWEKYPEAASHMSIHQLAILRLRAGNSERNSEEKLRKDPRLSWIFASPGTDAPRREIQRKAIRTCCFYTVLGFKWEPGTARGVMPAFNLDQLAQIHAMVMRGAVEREQFVESIMSMRDEDYTTYALPSLAALGMGLWSQDRIATLTASDTRSRQWLRKWAHKHDLQLQHLEPLEALRMDYATTAVIRRWFAEMLELVRSIPMQFRMDADEVMLTMTRSTKWVVGPGQQVFSRRTDKLPHFTVMACFNAEGCGPLPMIVVPNLATAKEVFREFRGNCLIVTTENGWVNGEAWVEWATMFCEWMHEHRVRLGKPHQEAVLFVDGAPTRGNVRALEIF